MFVRNFLSFQTPYNGLLLYHGLGSGKTCSAISVAEEMRDYLKQMGITQRIIVVAAPNVQDNFKLQLFDERKLKLVNGLWNIRACTGNKYMKEINPMNMQGLSKDKVVSQVKRIINTAYLFLGYIEFANYISKKSKVTSDMSEDKKQKVMKDKLIKSFTNRLIIIDEVHNIRISDDKKDQRIEYNKKDGIVPLNSLKQLSTYIINKCQNYSGPGHSGYILYDLRKLTKPFSSAEVEGADNVTQTCYNYGIFTASYLIDYIAEILKHFSKDGLFDDKAYFDVYRHNVDIWGLLTCYRELIETSPGKNYLKHYLMLKLSDVLFKYLYSGEYACKKIPVDELVVELASLNKIVGFKTKLKRKSKSIKINPTKKKTKKAKIKLVLRQASNNREISIPAGKKRCPNGYVKNPSTGKCKKKGTKAKSVKKRQIKTIGESRYSLFMDNGSPVHRARHKTMKRCPTGYKKVRIQDGFLICKKKK